MKLDFHGYARVRGSDARTTRGRAVTHVIGRLHAAGSPQGTRPADAMPPVKEAALRPGPRRSSAGTREASRNRRANPGAGSGSDRGGGLRANHPEIDSRYSAEGHHQRSRVPAAEVSRRRAHPMGHRAWRNAHRRHHHADQRRTRHRRHAAEVGNGDRAGGNGSGTRARGSHRRARICWCGRMAELERIRPEPQDDCTRHLRADS